MRVKFEKQDDGSIIVDDGAFTIKPTGGYTPYRTYRNEVTKRCDDERFVGSLHDCKSVIKNYVRQRKARGNEGGSWKTHIEYFDDQRKLYECDEARLQRVCEEAEADFWSTVAEGYPEITTGDLDPMAVMVFGNQVKEIVERWVETNKDCRGCANRGWLLKPHPVGETRIIPCLECNQYDDAIEAGRAAIKELNKEQS